MHRLGVTKILNGTDVSHEDRYSPLQSPQMNMEMIVKAGYTPLEALQATTINPASCLGFTDSLGAVATGKIADLVVLDADPLVDIVNARKLRAVVADGRYYDRAALDRLLKEGEDR
jgi:imidazolonepropionase-like amidohydrolase